MPGGSPRLQAKDRLALPGDPTSSRAARRFLSDVLAVHHLDHCYDDAGLVLAELVTNALLHAGTQIVVGVSVSDTALRLEVADGSPARPSARRHSLTATTGRGMGLVAALSSAWGVSENGSGKVVWAEIAVGEAAPGAGRTVPRAAGSSPQLPGDGAPAPRRRAGRPARKHGVAEAPRDIRSRAVFGRQPA